MAELIFMVGSPRSQNSGPDLTYRFADCMAYADWAEVRVRYESGDVVTPAETWPLFVRQFDRTTDDGTVRGARRLPANLLKVADIVGFIGAQCGINLRLEGTMDPRLVVEIVHHIVYRSGWHHTQFLVSGWNSRMLEQIGRYDEHIRTALVLEGTTSFCAEIARDVGAYAVQVEKEFVNSSMVRRCHENGIVVIAHNVNDVPHIEKMVQAGVDGIGTSFPSRYLRWCGRQGVEWNTPIEKTHCGVGFTQPVSLLE